MNVTDIIEIDLPTIIVLIVLWLIDHFKLRNIERKMDRVR